MSNMEQHMDFMSIFLSELLGTATLLLLGVGTVASNLLTKSKGKDSGFLFVNWGWGLAVMMGVLVAYKSGGHLNPAVTIGLLISGVSYTAAQVLAYILGQVIGSVIGGVLAWLAYKQHFDEEESSDKKLWCFATAPEIRSPWWNFVTETIATFVLVFVIVAAGKYTEHSGSMMGGPANLGWLGAFGVALLIVVIGIGLGGPTGYAINPVRDFGPRLAHAMVPIRGKGDSDWGYAWVPIVGPMVGGALAGAASLVLL